MLVDTPGSQPPHHLNTVISVATTPPWSLCFSLCPLGGATALCPAAIRCLCTCDLLLFDGPGLLVDTTIKNLISEVTEVQVKPLTELCGLTLPVQLYPGGGSVVKLMETLCDWLLSLPLQRIPYQAVLDLVDNKMRVRHTHTQIHTLKTHTDAHSS